MVVSQPPEGSTYEDEIRTAAKAGVNAFALNFGGWEQDFDRWETYLEKMYVAANNVNNDGSRECHAIFTLQFVAEGVPFCAVCPFKLFFSFDMTSVSDPAMIVRIVKKYKDNAATLYIDNGGLMLSTFQLKTDPGFDWQTAVLDPISSSLGSGKYVSFWPGTLNTDASKIFANDYQPYTDGQFSWV